MDDDIAREPDTSSLRAALEWVQDESERLSEEEGIPPSHARDAALLTLGFALGREDKVELSGALASVIANPPATMGQVDAIDQLVRGWD